MSLIRQIRRYLTREDRVQRLPSHLITPSDISDAEIWPILATARAKDEFEARSLMEQYQVSTAADLMDILPPRKKPTLKQRIIALIQRMEGSYPYDPIAAQMRRHLDNHEQRVTIRHRYSDRGDV